MRVKRSASTTKRCQQGAYAVEFAFVFALAFGLLYAIICYGILFTFRFALQDAAEDGARAALRYQVSLAAREAEAVRVARQHVSGWLPASMLANLEVVPQIQRADAALPCARTWDQRCSVVLTLTVRGVHEVLPPFPGFALPQTLNAQAGVLLEGSAL